MIKLDISYQLTVDETEKITREERERRRKIRFQQVREISKTNAAKVRKAVTKTKVKELNKLFNTINEDLNKEKSEKIAELTECYRQSISNIGHAQRLAAQKDDPDIAKRRMMKRYKKDVKLRHNVALSKLHEDKVTKYVRENKHIISRKAALETEKARAMKIASLPQPEKNIFEEVKQLTVPAKKNKTTAPHSRISYPSPPVVEKHDKKSVKDGYLAAQAQDLLLQEQQRQIKQTSEKQEHIQKERYQKALQIELLNRDSKMMMKEISFIQKKQTRQRQKNLAKIPKQVFLPPYKRQENLQNKQKLMEKDFEQIYVSNETELKSDLNVLLEPHPPVETAEPTDSLDLTLNSSDQESTPTLTRQDHSTTMRDITNIPAAQKGKEKSTLQSLFNRIKSQRSDWISGMTDSLQYVETGQRKMDKSDYLRSQIPMSSEEGSSDFPVDEASTSVPTRDGIGFIPSTEGTDESGVRVVRVHDDKGHETKGVDSDSITEEIRQPGIPEPVSRAFKLQQQIQQVMEQKKRIEEQRRKLEEKLHNFDKGKRVDRLSGYKFSPQQVASPETKESVGDSSDQTDSPAKQTFPKEQKANIQELLEHGRALIQSSMAHIKDSIELHQKDSTSLEFLPQLNSTTLGKHFPLTFSNLPDNISKVRDYQKHLLEKHEEKLKSPLSSLEAKIPSQNAVAATSVSEMQNTGEGPLLLSPPSPSFRLPFDQNEEFVGVDVGTDYSRIRPNISLSSATSQEAQGSTPTSKLEQLFRSFKTLKGLKPNSAATTEKTETKFQEDDQQLDWLNSLPNSLLPSSTSFDKMEPENILQKKDILLPPGTDGLGSIGSQKPRQQYQQRQSGLLSLVPEKSDVPFYDVDLLNMLPEKDTESLPSDDSQKLSQYTDDDDSSSFLTELLSSGINGHTDTGYSSEHIWGRDLIKNASNNNDRIQSNQYSLQKQLSNIEEQTKLLNQQLSASNEQFDIQVKEALKLKEEIGSLATRNSPSLQIVPMDQRRPPPIQRSAFINGHFPHELSAIEEAESILMTSCRSDSHRRYSSLSPITVDRDHKKSGVQLDRSNCGNTPQHSRQDFSPSQTSVSMDQAPCLSSTGFPDPNASSRSGPLSPKSFSLWQDTSVSVSGKAEEEDSGRNGNYSVDRIWREILERSKFHWSSEDVCDVNHGGSKGLSPTSMKTANPEENFGPLQCDPKSSETSSDEIKLPSVLPPDSSTVLPSSHLTAATSESSLSEILSEGGSLSRELMDNHRDLSAFLSQLRLLALKNRAVSMNSLRTATTKSDATQNFAEDGTASVTDKPFYNSVLSVANATVSTTDSATIPEADRTRVDQSEISKFALFHCSDKNLSIAATNGNNTTFDSAIVNNITRQDSVSNIDSIPVLETSTTSVSVPENSFDLAEIIAPLLSKFKDRLFISDPFRASSPISSLTHVTKLPDSSSLTANQDLPPKTASQFDDSSSQNTFPSLEKLRAAQALSPQEPAYRNSPTPHYSPPQTNTSTLSSLPFSHTTLHSCSDQSNMAGTNQICAPEPPELLSPTISQYSYSSSSSLDEIDTDDHQLLATDQNLCLSDKSFKEINLQNSKDQQQQQQSTSISVPSDSMFYSNPCNRSQSLSPSSPPPPSSNQVVSQRSPGASHLLPNGAVKDQGLEESSVSDSTSRSQCTVVMRKVSSKKMPFGHSASSPSSSSSTTTATIGKSDKTDAMKSTSFANSAQIWSEIPSSKTASSAMMPPENTKSADCHSSSSASSLTQYSYSSSPSPSSSQEDLSTNSNCIAPNPSKGPAMCEAKIFFNPLSNGADVITQEEKTLWGDGPEADDANEGAWFSLIQEDISIATPNGSPLFKHESLPLSISPILSSIHSESTDDTPDRYSSPPLHFQQVVLQSTCKKENPYHQTLPDPVTLNVTNSSSSLQPMSTSSTTMTALTQQSNVNNSSLSGENNSSSGQAVTTLTSSSTLSGLSDLSLPSNIKQDYQVLLDQARTFMKRFKENEKMQNASNSQTSQDVCKEPTALEQQEPNRATAFEQQRLSTAGATELQRVNMPTAFDQQGPNIASAFEQQGPNIAMAFEQQGPNVAKAFEQQRLTTTGMQRVNAPTAFEQGLNIATVFEQGPNIATAFEQQSPNIATAFEQQGPNIAGATELQGVNVPTALEQQGTNVTTAVDQQGPIAPTATELQGVDETAPIEQLDPNDVAEIIQRHEISLKRFDSIFDQMQQSPDGILEEPDLSLVSSETLSNLEYGSS
ncbi:serine-rich adhesin for platelets-like isoform X2 [Octopus sinensis]|uniref:Serine-rich adhesin for platelets-like isoform X2 n=1 Tax=Octopus sinensis TaxID=2607531 RepID=A0A7E6FLS5_9MOLL|nr:serine-rich adhesin for platelets-like isoform X2 [Octopus sinensis]